MHTMSSWKLSSRRFGLSLQIEIQLQRPQGHSPSRQLQHGQRLQSADAVGSSLEAASVKMMHVESFCKKGKEAA